uniref:Uncharacterized protein n=1 Tax=Oryza sativa subsp. japonica TaxID=39947 RepID=Q6Z151_ORYSJ|nr:hypothetical protein [Oryza sativa Japonica Group]BAD30841.1 hypothetical protein [Oryza sativa Japonica Group]
MQAGQFHAVLASVLLPPVVIVVLSLFPAVFLLIMVFVPLSSRARSPSAFRQVCCCPIVVFVLSFASSSVAPASSRLRPRVATEVSLFVAAGVPRAVSAVPVHRRRSASRPICGEDPSPRFPLLVLSVFVTVHVVPLSTPVPVYRCRRLFVCTCGDRVSMPTR